MQGPSWTLGQRDDPLKSSPAYVQSRGVGLFFGRLYRPLRSNGARTHLHGDNGWKSGSLPPMRRIIWRDVPSAGSLLALTERGDADISYGVPPKDAKEIAIGKRARGKLKIVGVPIPNAIWYVGMNVKNLPFSDVKVRQAVAYALPYEPLLQVAIYDRALPLFGTSADQPMTSAWPQPFPYQTNLELGSYALEALIASDYAPVQGFVLTLAVLYVMLNLCIDIAYGLIDPRVRVEG
jgi:ABC-type transport system substrate-binding protein